MQTTDKYALADGSYQHALLRDAARLDAYAAAVAGAVRPGDVVADLGTGSGVLAALAVRAGAARVHAVEEHRHAAAHARSLLALNGLADRVTVHEADVERWVPPEPVQVVVAELMETGLLHEPMAAALRQVDRWPTRPRTVVPAGARLLVEGVAIEDVFHGYRAPLPGFRATESGTSLTDAGTIAAFHFLERAPPEGVDATVPLAVRARGTLTALRLRTVAEFGGGRTHGASPAHCTPVVLPLAAPVAVRAGDALKARVRYTFAFDARPLEYDLSCA